jgi:hypothetical protein
LKPVQRVNAPAIGTEVVLASFPTGADWWDPDGAGLCIWAAYQPKLAANLAASYIDLSGNGNNCAPGVAPAWDAVNGWRFNGINHWLDTFFQPQNDQTQSLIVQYTNFVNGGAHHTISGVQQGDRFEIDAAVFGNNHRYANGGFVQINVATPPNGNYCVAGNQGYQNGAPDGAPIGGYGGAININTYIGAVNNFGAAARFCQVDIQAYALYDCTLNAAQVAAVAAAMAAI